MDSLFPLLESAFSKAFGNLTIIQKVVVSRNAQSTSSTVSTSISSTNWDIGIVSFVLTVTDGITSSGTIMAIPGTVIGNNDSRITVSGASISAYTRAAVCGASATLVTFKQS